MTDVITFNLGNSHNSKSAPVLPEALDGSKFHTRAELRAHKIACEEFHNYQREAEYQAKVAESNKRAREQAEAQREMTDEEYDNMKRKEWQAEKDKEAARLAVKKEKEREEIAYRLSMPAVADIHNRSEYLFLKDFEFWTQKGYTLQPDGIQIFQPGIYNAQLTAPAVAKKAGK